MRRPVIRVLTSVIIIICLLIVTISIWAYLYFWPQYRLFWSNTTEGMTLEERARELAGFGPDSLDMMIARIRDNVPGAIELSVDAIEIMHSESLEGPGFLYTLIEAGDEDALQMLMFLTLRAPLDRYRHTRLYGELAPDRVIRAVEDYAANYSGSGTAGLGEQALAALVEERSSLVEGQSIRDFDHALPDDLRREVLETLITEREADRQLPLVAVDQSGQFQGLRSNLLIRYINLFVTFHEQHPDLTDEQLYEVASLIGNDLGMNARYFFGYRNGLPEEGVFIPNPGYDYAHTGDNLRTIR